MLAQLSLRKPPQAGFRLEENAMFNSDYSFANKQIRLAETLRLSSKRPDYTPDDDCGVSGFPSRIPNIGDYVDRTPHAKDPYQGLLSIPLRMPGPRTIPPWQFRHSVPRYSLRRQFIRQANLTAPTELTPADLKHRALIHLWENEFHAGFFR